MATLGFPRQAMAAVPDPSQLPVAGTGTPNPDTAAYNALNVPGMAAGSFYLDPVSGVKVYKLTSSSFPGGSSHYHDYAEGGHEISLPHTGTTRSFFCCDNLNAAPYHIIDFTPGVGVSNNRTLSGSFQPRGDLAFTFSNNAATPYYAYVGTGSQINRFDFRTMTLAPGGGWPITGANAVDTYWFHQAKDDSLFTWMVGAEDNVRGYEPSTGTMKSLNNSQYDEPRLDREGRYIGIGGDIGGNTNVLVSWDWLNNTIVYTGQGSNNSLPYAHNGGLRGYWVNPNWDVGTTMVRHMSAVAQEVNFGNTWSGDPGYGSALWIQPSGATGNFDQWFLMYPYNGFPSNALGDGAIVLGTVNGDATQPNGRRRYLCHPYNTTGAYGTYTWAKSTADGFYVLFTSNMNGSGRYDQFAAELPTTGGTPPNAPTNLRLG
jgi:hypothetical protein